MIDLLIAAIGALLLVLTGRTWLDFTNRSEQLNGQILKFEGLYAEHVERLEQVRVRAAAVTEQTDAAVEECNELETEMREQSEELGALLERLERLQPSERRIDKKGDRGGFSWRQ